MENDIAPEYHLAPEDEPAAKADKRGTVTQALGRYQIVFAPGSLTRKLLIVTLVFIGLHGILAFYNYRIQDLEWLILQLIDMDEENNLPTWFSGYLLLTTSVFLWLCARRKKEAGDRLTSRWYILAVGFLALSIDEVAGIHETINSATEMTWAIPGGILAIVLGLAFIPFLRQIPGRTALMFLAGGATYIGGAVGMEFVGDPIPGDSLAYYMATMVEEGMEMLGIVLFLHALLRYMTGKDGESVGISVNIG